MSNDPIRQFIQEIIEQELEEANAMGSGAVVGYTGPVGMDTEPGTDLLWSDPKEPGVGDKLKSENVLDKMGQKHVGGANRKEPYGDTYVGFSSGKEEDESGREKQAGIVKQVNKNLEKKPYTLHDPPGMGISIKRPHLKDRKNQ